ncbi:hypothetical protein LTR66_009660 [Elasticomyces elasticus]|nr:hypothetical protein LTR66_009660 [Elasticomyces elasticus]
MADSTLDEPPHEMFTILKNSSKEGLGPRLGRLALQGRHAIDTPHYLAITSRGAVPHVSQDNFTRHTAINGVYVALEDYIERAPPQTPPILGFHNNDAIPSLRRFIALPAETLLVLGLRRCPPVPCPSANTSTAVKILTSVGFRTVDTDDYTDAALNLKPDIVVALGDVPFGQPRVGIKRVDKITDRTIAWVKEMFTMKADKEDEGADKEKLPAVFAPILPLSIGLQRWYIEALLGELKENMSGLALYDTTILEDIPDKLRHLPRLAFPLSSTDTGSPPQLLQDIARGVDIFTIPFIGAATDAGIALDFSFPAPVMSGNAPLPLGIDMWSSVHATDLSPLRTGCECYACAKHHRAYLQHLLSAKEMLGWVLLQIHNHYVVDRFFAGVRQSIAQDLFETEKEAFERVYEPDLPEKTGQGPRVRGYHFKSEGPNEPKRNPAPFKPFKRLDDHSEKIAEGSLPDSRVEAAELEGRGFGTVTE